ncbi:MAG: hypothetical protein K5905_22415 [Roseibium sp.]|uniref:hypothetical protein n=1 Tax=Roseibium sp. TaxID=1936156 RepID=UPI00261D6079|nr:hypothetical protein [Roseibium sp.]MCV0428219.1 hypothetical protein [Roseibium sp.]
MITVVKFLFRVFGYGFLAVAIIAGISDASTSIAQSQMHLAPLGQVWFNLSPETLNLSQAVIQRYVHPSLWDPALQTVLTWPVWAVFAPLGLGFMWLGAKRRQHQPQFA